MGHHENTLLLLSGMGTFCTDHKPEHPKTFVALQFNTKSHSCMRTRRQNRLCESMLFVNRNVFSFWQDEPPSVHGIGYMVFWEATQNQNKIPVKRHCTAPCLAQTATGIFGPLVGHGAMVNYAAQQGHVLEPRCTKPSRHRFSLRVKASSTPSTWKRVQQHFPATTWPSTCPPWPE